LKVVPEQMVVAVSGEVIVGVGSTVIEKPMVAPEQLLDTGVISILAVTGTVPVLMAVNELIFPLPLAGNPMDGKELVQL
jgi:hypothetical protein